VINGAECEPYITCDDMLMRERAEEIVRGVEIMQYLLNAERSLIGIEDNKPEAVAAMREACAKRNSISVVVVPTRYPSGGAKQLIKLLTGLEVPKGKLSPELGVQCFNVATAYTLARFIHHGEPVIARIVTLTGAVNNPGNFEVPLGMLMDDLLEAAGGTQADCNGLIMGGPMMGFNLPSNHVPVVKATNCIIASASEMFPPKPTAMPCIRCARCADACPASLQPQELYWFSKSSNFEKARDYSLFDCIECGCCDYVCPSNIPLVDYYRFAKSEIIAADKAKEAANLARERNEFRLARIEREKAERAEKHAKKAAGANAGATAAPDAAADAKKAAIAAAIARAQAQKAEVTPQNTEVSEKKQAEIAEIDARRAQVNEPLASDNDVKQE
jgi:electron transport complex protein RnfC